LRFGHEIHDFVVGRDAFPAILQLDGGPHERGAANANKTRFDERQRKPAA
jgi:hypothetical protein